MAQASAEKADISISPKGVKTNPRDDTGSHVEISLLSKARII
jgi:hypothetical protein